MNKSSISATSAIRVPVIALTFYAVASGYLMSLIPLVLPFYGLDVSYASSLASVFYAGLLLGSLFFENVVRRIGHRNAFIACLSVFSLSIVVLPLFPHASLWLFARLLAGIAVAGVFVVVESWLMAGDENQRAKRLSFYMLSLYGGAALGQFGIGVFGVEGLLPFAVILSLLVLAILVLTFIAAPQPQSHQSAPLSLRQISRLSHAALIGCIISGLTLGAIYGLMPVELDRRLLSQEQIGTLMALVILGGMAVQPVVTMLDKRMSRTVAMAFFSLLGLFGIGLTLLSSNIIVLASALFVLGMSTFALYPVAINLGCEGLDERYIVSATQVMLFSYSIGSVTGPMMADRFMTQTHGLLSYLFAALLAACVYMFIAAIRGKKPMVAGE